MISICIYARGERRDTIRINIHLARTHNAEKKNIFYVDTPWRHRRSFVLQYFASKTRASSRIIPADVRLGEADDPL